MYDNNGRIWDQQRQEFIDPYRRTTPAPFYPSYTSNNEPRVVQLETRMQQVLQLLYGIKDEVDRISEVVESTRNMVGNPTGSWGGSTGTWGSHGGTVVQPNPYYADTSLGASLGRSATSAQVELFDARGPRTEAKPPQ